MNVDNNNEPNISNKKTISKNSIKPKKKTKKYKYTLTIAVVIMGVILVIKSNEDLYSPISSNIYGVNWSEPKKDIINTKQLEYFNKELDKNKKKYDKNIVIVNQHDGCGACFKDIIDLIENNSKELNKEKIGVILLTTLVDEHIEMYKDRKVNILSDSDYSIGSEYKIYSEETDSNENVILIFDKDKVDEYYYENVSDIEMFLDEIK